MLYLYICCIYIYIIVSQDIQTLHYARNDLILVPWSTDVREDLRDLLLEKGKKFVFLKMTDERHFFSFINK